jgi:hypothetical protein
MGGTSVDAGAGECLDGSSISRKGNVQYPTIIHVTYLHTDMNIHQSAG